MLPIYPDQSRGISQQRLRLATKCGIDLRYLQRWSAARRKDPLVQMGVDEIYFGKQVVLTLEQLATPADPSGTGENARDHRGHDGTTNR